jgi:hypothetical protein
MHDFASRLDYTIYMNYSHFTTNVTYISLL